MRWGPVGAGSVNRIREGLPAASATPGAADTARPAASAAAPPSSRRRPIPAPPAQKSLRPRTEPDRETRPLVCFTLSVMATGVRQRRFLDGFTAVRSGNPRRVRGAHNRLRAAKPFRNPRRGIVELARRLPPCAGIVMAEPIMLMYQE
jgi:hypothetical protein